jgi:hypothetical protein
MGAPLPLPLAHIQAYIKNVVSLIVIMRNVKNRNVKTGKCRSVQ